MTLAIAVLSFLLFSREVMHSWAEHRWQQERQRLTNAVVARHAGEYAALEHIDHPPAVKPPREPRLRGVGSL